MRKPPTVVSFYLFNTSMYLCIYMKLQYFGYLMQRAESLEKTPMLVKTVGRSRRGWRRMRWTDPLDMYFSKLQEIVKNRRAWPAAVHEVTKRRTQLSNWTTVATLACIWWQRLNDKGIALSRSCMLCSMGKNKPSKVFSCVWKEREPCGACRVVFSGSFFPSLLGSMDFLISLELKILIISFLYFMEHITAP